MVARKPRSAQNTPTPGWVILLIGIGLGLLFAYLIHSVFLTSSEQEKTAKKPVNSTMKIPENKLPRFEFYSILPELEVVIPEQFTDSLKKVLPQKKTDEKKSEQSSEQITHTPTGTTETYFIQAGSFKKQADAERMKIKLLLLGLDVETRAVEVEGSQYHRVRIGPLTDYGAFETARDRLRENNIQYIVLKSREQ